METLKELCTMLYGCPDIHVLTDHKTTCLNACKYNVSCAGAYSWMTFQSNSITSKAIAACLLMLFPDFLLMRGRNYMPCLASTTMAVHDLALQLLKLPFEQLLTQVRGV
jgi:hypothetical protein